MIDLNIKVRIKTLVGANIGEYLHDFDVDKDFFLTGHKKVCH